MSDDQHRPPDDPVPPEGDNDNAAPSTIFVELMREAAAKRAERMEKRDMYRRPRVERVRREEREEDEEPSADASQSTEKEDTSQAEVAAQTPSQSPSAPVESAAESESAGVASDQPEQNMPTYYDILFEEIEPASDVASKPPTSPRREKALQPDASPEPDPKTAHPSIPIYEPPSEEELARAEKLAQQRVQRVRRRKERRRQRRAGLMGGFVYTLLIVGIAACIGSTIFTWFTDPQFFDSAVVSGLQVVDATGEATNAPTSMPTPNWFRRVGIVSGHRGPEDDPGAVCDDGLTEAEINFNVATLVVRNLRALGYSVDLLDEFDTRLDNYQAAALVSIHANDCRDYGEVVSGFLVAKAAARAEGGPDSRLAECIAQYYGDATGLNRGFNLTIDMTDYHSFREIHPLTPAAILELGFMRADRDLLTGEPDLMAQAITQGVLCFLNPNDSQAAQPEDVPMTPEVTSAVVDPATDTNNTEQPTDITPEGTTAP
jgi:N-acetylmuramoyl-L-alanine amidase